MGYSMLRVDKFLMKRPNDRLDLPDDLRIYGITNNIFKKWTSDIYSRENIRKTIGGKIRSAKVNVLFDVRKIHVKTSFEKNLISLTWSGATDLLVFSSVRPFVRYLFKSRFVSSNRIRKISDMKYLDLGNVSIL